MTPSQIPDLLSAIGAKQPRIKFNAAKALEKASSEAPATVYPHFDFFAAMLGHPNNILHWHAIRTLANLAAVDTDAKLELILDTYLAPIAGPSMITAAHTIHGAARIALAKPQLAAKITRKILRVGDATYKTPECVNVAIGHALRALATLPPSPAIRAFAERHVRNPRHATAAKAEKLLRGLERRARSGKAAAATA